MNGGATAPADGARRRGLPDDHRRGARRFLPPAPQLRALIDPAGGLDRVESTVSYIFALPAVLALAWVSLYFGREALRRAQTLPNVAVEFAAAAVVAFGVFYLSIDRAVAALYAGF